MGKPCEKCPNDYDCSDKYPGLCRKRNMKDEDILESVKGSGRVTINLFMCLAIIFLFFKFWGTINCVFYWKYIF